MTGRKVHVLSDVDGDRGTCAHCGPVELLYRAKPGRKPYPQCAVARRGEHQHDRDDREPWGSYVKPNGHGLTIAEARERKRGKTCEGCGGEHRLTNDHNHLSGQLRGILCNGCNRAVGLVGDDPAVLRALADYLDRHAHSPGPGGGGSVC